jgi:hypothetical protein
MAHYLTNRGKLILAQGDWDDAVATDIRLLLCSGASIPVAIDSQLEANPLNFVSDFLALGSVVEANFTNYARQNLTRTNAAEDDGNNRVNLDASDVVINNAGGATNNTLWGGLIFKFVTNDAASPALSVFTFASTITTNGSNLTLAIADLYRIS